MYEDFSVMRESPVEICWFVLSFRQKQFKSKINAFQDRFVYLMTNRFAVFKTQYRHTANPPSSLYARVCSSIVDHTGRRYIMLSSPAQTLESWVRIPLEAWMSVCAYSVFLLSCVHVAALRRADPPSKKSYRMCKRWINWKKRPKGPTKGFVET
jgi:hypothetical protein